jgi:hypothetical protein
VQVTTAGGTAGDGSVDDIFNYTPVVPTITSVSPNEQGTIGDSTITITGTGFTSDATVNFGSAGAASGVTVLSLTSLTAVSPPAPAGTVDITVTTSGGTSAVTSADHFTYVTETPTMTVSPQLGNSPGDTLTVTGSGFPTGTVLLLEADPLAGIAGESTIGNITLSTYADATVDNNGNFTEPFTLANPFSPLEDTGGACPPPQNEVDMGLVGCAIAAINVNNLSVLADVPVIFSGTQADPPTLAVPSTVVHVGNTVSFSGSGWWGSYPGGGATAKICGIKGKSTDCSATTGSGVVAPVVDSGAGGHLQGATVSGSIKVASSLAGCTTCFLRVIQPNLTPLPGKVEAEIALTILPDAPTVISVSPNSGPTGGGTKVTIRGTGFTKATAVLFGSTPATRFTRVRSTEITATAPKHRAGIVDVTVSNSGGRSATSVRDGFTFKT